MESMEIQKLQEMVEYFSIIPDPRKDINKKHKLTDILVLVVLGILSGCDSYVEIEEFGKERGDLLKRFLTLPNGIPSHDTLSRVLGLVNAEVIQSVFIEWCRKELGTKKVKHIAIDGKTFNGTSSEQGKFSHLGMVSAYSTDQGICLGAQGSSLKNEKENFKNLIGTLDLRGAVVTMDAGGLTASILSLIREKRGHFMVALKSPHTSLINQLNLEFKNKGNDIYIEEEKTSHGRKEQRICEVVSLSKVFNERIKKNRRKEYKKGDYPEFKKGVRITSRRVYKGKESITERYYISSVLRGSAKRFCDLIRSHWQVENNLHWSLDVTFNEDKWTVKNSATNLGILRRFALNLLKKDKTKKSSMRVKRKLMGWSEEYFLQVLTQVANEA